VAKAAAATVAAAMVAVARVEAATEAAARAVVKEIARAEAARVAETAAEGTLAAKMAMGGAAQFAARELADPSPLEACEPDAFEQLRDPLGRRLGDPETRGASLP
jgi:hypothetical protein